MTTIRRYFDALRIAVAAFRRFARPPPDQPDIVEELLAGTQPQAMLDIDWDAIRQAVVERPVFFLTCFSEDENGDLVLGAMVEMTVREAFKLLDMDLDEFLAEPAAVQNAFFANLGAGVGPPEALADAQAAPMVVN